MIPEIISSEAEAPISIRISPIEMITGSEVLLDFSFDFIGSSARNMITCDYTTNKGFDFDMNYHINDPDEAFSASWT